MNEGKLRNVTLYKDRHNYCLRTEYTYTDSLGNIRELVIPKVVLPISNCPQINYNKWEDIPRSINLGFGDLPVYDEFIVTDNIVEYAVKEMTLEEIEEKLGHKVKIISSPKVMCKCDE